MASSSSTAWKYDVFLNFRGPDTREDFTNVLYDALLFSGINTFMDNDLELGAEISPALVQKIKSSKISVVIFSEHYASSSYCLEELELIIECRESIGQYVIPVFYNVDPTDIEELRGSFGEAFVKHEDKYKGQKLKDWKSALQKTTAFTGRVITNKKDLRECIKKIVSTISKKLNEEKKRTFERQLKELHAMEADINSQLVDGKFIFSQKQKDEAGYWLTNVGRINGEAKVMQKQMETSEWTVEFRVCVQIMIEELRKLIDQKDRLASTLVDDAPQANREAFLLETLVGREFQLNMDSILICLSMDEVSNIGICGMDGVGKTTLVTHIHNKLLEDPTKFPNVYWVNMSQDFSVHKLQSLIAERLGFDFGTEGDVRVRAARLSKELQKRCRFVLIIDDLWKPIDLKEVGIPLGGGYKLIITTRSIEVCKQTKCQIMKEVQLLNEEEAWDLFVETSGCDLPSNVVKIARSVVKECVGLPLAIVTMAGSMRGVDDLRVWKNALRELESSIIRNEDMEEKVFRILRYSYNFLNDPALQQCFLYCALFPEDKNINREKLIAYLIVEEIIDPDIDLRQAKHDKGHTMLNKLTNVSLLERGPLSGDRVKMHDLMRDMAIQIIKECQPSIIESGKSLRYVPDEKYWRKDIVRVSLMDNYITKIPSNFSPSCPHLSTLLLSNNKTLFYIADSFFDHLQGLKVLDLSHTAIKELPKSIDSLKNLTTLLLSCSDISNIPTLANLKSLQWLDLMNCRSIEKVPEGLEYLSNLRYLDVARTGLWEFPTGILPKLFCLQYLIFDCPSKNAEELGGLWKLEHLYWCFPSVGDLLTFGYLISKEAIKQMKFYLLVGLRETSIFGIDDAERTVMLNDCTIPEEIRELRLQIDYLFLDHVSLENGRCLGSHIPAGLKWLTIENLQIAYLFSLAFWPSNFQSIEELRVRYINNLIVLFLDSESMVPRSPNPTFSFSLKLLKIVDCPVKKLLPHGLLSYLRNLESIHVIFCVELEEIISLEENSHTLLLSLPNLRKLHLIELPKLKRICSKQIKCECLQIVRIYDCEELQDVSISLPLPHLQSVEVHPINWWESVKWGEPDQKDALPIR